MKQELITKDIIKSIKSYYQDCKLWMPDKSQWRTFKFKLPNNTYKRFHIKNNNEFRKLLIKYTPFRVYYSSVAIYNIRNTKGKMTKNKIISIFKDSIIDLDNPDFEECRKSAIEVINRIGIIPSYILKTYKGIHICYYKQRVNPKLLKDIKDFDYHTLENEYNEFSVPFTLNKGKVCTFITYDQLLNTPTNELEAKQREIYHFQYDCIEEPESSEKNNDQVVQPHLRRNASEMQSKLDRPVTLTGSKEQVLLSINNQVKKGIYVPILIYYKSFKGLKNELDNLNNLFNLGDLYAYENENYYAFISLRTFEKRQLEKLLNQSSSISKIQFNKFSKIWFDISEYQMMGIIRYKQRKYLRVSKKHYNFITDCGIKVGLVDELVGHPKLKIYEVHKK